MRQDQYFYKYYQDLSQWCLQVSQGKYKLL